MKLDELEPDSLLKLTIILHELYSADDVADALAGRIDFILRQRTAPPASRRGSVEWHNISFCWIVGIFPQSEME